MEGRGREHAYNYYALPPLIEGEGEDGEWMRSTYNLKNSVTTRDIKAASLSPSARYRGEGEGEDGEWMRSTT